MGQFLRGKGYAERGEVHTLPIRGKKNTGEEKKRGEGQGKRGRGRREKGKGYATGRKTSDDVWTKRRQT
jgi:hypothetical protein